MYSAAVYFLYMTMAQVGIVGRTGGHHIRGQGLLAALHMSKDHYVAQTYLRHFADGDGLLHVYRKSDGKYWQSGPKGVCHEWDGDLIRDFVKDEEMLGKYRAIFEPRWNDAITDLTNGVCDAAVKMAIAGYWANLLVCTPAWTRIGIKMHDYNMMHRLRAEEALRAKAGKPDLKLRQMLADLDSASIGSRRNPTPSG